ncbi:MAG: putative motility protein [Gammaproteobacteria bacterium]|nr:putative motility protein [Gammaproteobacteria bacterium]
MQLQAAMLSKKQDVMQQQGQAMLKLVESAASTAPQGPQGSVGSNLNVWA